MVNDNEDRLKAVLLEYEIFRREAMETVSNQLKIYTFALSAVTIVFGYLLINKMYDALLFLPLITILLAYRWIWDVQMTTIYSNYVEEIEKKKIPKLIGYFDESLDEADHLRYWIGWRHYYEATRLKRSRSWFFSVALLLGFPTAVSLVYFLWAIFYDSSMLVSRFPRQVYILALLAYGFLCIHIVYTTKTWERYADSCKHHEER